jgi:hypothetical protein
MIDRYGVEPSRLLDPSRMVRADSRSRTLHSFAPNLLISERSSQPRHPDGPLSPPVVEKRHNCSMSGLQLYTENLKRSKVDVRLKSILSLRDTVQKDAHSGKSSDIDQTALTELLSSQPTV